MALGQADHGAGNVHIPLVFTNTGDSACTLSGYPGVSLIQRDGQTIGKPATHEGGATGAVRLEPGKQASAVLHTVNEGVSQKPCWKDAHLIKAYPPGSKQSLDTRPQELRVCGDRFSVTTVRSGSQP